MHLAGIEEGALPADTVFDDQASVVIGLTATMAPTIGPTLG